MRKFLPVVFCGLAAISYSQLTLAGGAYKDKERSAGAGTSLSSEVRDAQGREHLPQGTQADKTKDKDGALNSDRSSGANSPATSGAGATSPTDAAVQSDSSAGARTGDASVGGSADTGASGAARGEVK